MLLQGARGQGTQRRIIFDKDYGRRGHDNVGTALSMTAG